jgi:nucleoside phosphorylase
MPDSKFRQKHPNLPCAVILTAISEEYKAVSAHLDIIERDQHPDKTIYRCGIFSSNECSWVVSIALIGPENDNAAVETKRAIDYFKPNVVLFVGVAGGIKDVKLGDVVVATKIYGYKSGKVTEQGFSPRPDAPRVSYALEQLARVEATEDEWLQHIKGGRRKRPPQAFVAPIASSNIVLASKESDEYKRLVSNYGDALAVEMEGHGFLIAVRANLEVNALVIRGISDLIEGKNRKGENTWKITAAAHASAFAFQILAKLDLGQSEIQQLKELQEELKKLQAEKASQEETNATEGQQIRQLDSNIAALEQQLQDEISPQFSKALDWLANRQDLAKKAVERVLANSPNLTKIIDEQDSAENAVNWFCWDTEDYLERIYYSLYTDNRDLLHDPDIPMRLPVEAYVKVLRYIEQRVPEDINSEVPQLKANLEYLIIRLLL